MTADVVLDPSRMVVDKDGVRGFAWPVSMADVVATREAMLPGLFNAARESVNGWDEDAELLSVVLPYLINEALSLFQAHALVRRCRAEGRNLVVPDGSRYLASAVKAEAPGHSHLHDLLQSPRPPRSRFHHWAREARDRGKWARWLPKRARPFDRDRDIVATQRLPLIRAYGQKIGHAHRVVHPAAFFTQVDEYQARRMASGLASSPIVGAAIDAIEEGFMAGGEDFPAHVRDHFKLWLSQAMGMSKWHLAYLIKRSERLPLRLWTGTGSKIWVRILRHATRRSGGEVTGFSHGHGHSRTSIIVTAQAVSDFDSCDVFVTDNRVQAAAYVDDLANGLRLMTTIPQFITVQDGNDAEAERRSAGFERPEDGPRGRSRRIMYPTLFYPDDSVQYFVQLPTPVAVDWQARLLWHLGEWGYDVVIKPHPGTKALPPSVFTDLFKATVLSDRLETVLDHADSFVADSSTGSAFAMALATNKAVTLVDYGRTPFKPDALAKLKRRSAIVRTSFEPQNRLQVDWDQLNDALEKSRGLTDTAFCDSYLDRDRVMSPAERPPTEQQ